jgi:membrane protein YdbS with pleckstrin-like domain
MTSSQRAQYERPELAGPDRAMRVTNRRAVVAFTAFALVLLAALVYAVAWGIDNWWQGLVLGVIVVTTVGLMIAVSPSRRV